MTVQLVIEDFTVARNGRAVVREVNLEIPEGEVTALLGPNGAGKSSLVLGVAGLLPAEGRRGAARRPRPHRAPARRRSARPESRSCRRAGGCCRS